MRLSRLAVFFAPIVALLIVACARVGGAQNPPAAGSVRTAFWNIEWFSEDANPTRISNIKSVLGTLKPDILGMSEIQSRRSLTQILGSEWEIGIGDFPEAYQELAIAVRRPYRLTEWSYIFEDESLDFAWPRTGRDCLKAIVTAPDGSQVTVYVVHFKSRGGGRLATDIQRVMSAGLLASYIVAQKEKNYVVIGDMNDAPNDRSVNVLVSGDLFAKGGQYAQPRLLHNLMNSLWDQDFVTYGMDEKFLGDPIPPIAAGAKADNDRLRGIEYRFPDDARVLQIMFDMVLVSPAIMERGPTTGHVYGGPDAMRGLGGRVRVSDSGVEYLEKGTLASDHLPVYADLRLK